MKNRILTFFFATTLLWAGTVTAQNTLPNASLDTWVSRNGYEAPQEWVTSDDVLAQLGTAGLVRTVAKTTDVRAGAFAALLTPKRVPFVNLAVPAGLLAGKRFRYSATDPANVNNFGGVPYTLRPSSLSFWYKFAGTTADKTQVVLALTKGNLSSGGTVVGSGTVTLPAGVTTYTQYTLPITYASAETPDTLRLGFIVGADQMFSSSAAFAVDDISLALTTATASPAVAAALSVYPNPSTNGLFSLASLQRPGLATAPLSVTDALGKVVVQQGAAPGSAANGRSLDLRGLPAGVYLLRLDTPDGTVVRKLQLQ